MKDLRSFLSDYEKAFPKDVLHLDMPLKAEYECSSIAEQFEELNRFPVLVFENVINMKGERSKFRCVTGLLGDRKKMAFAIGSTWEDVAIDWRKRIQDHRIDPVIVPRKDAPCKQNIRIHDLDLYDLPILRHHTLDPGPYLTAGMFTCYDPETGVENSAAHRGFIAGPKEIRTMLTPHTHNAIIQRRHEKNGKEMKVAYWVGHHPAAWMGCQSRIEFPGSHFKAAGALLNEPLRLVQSETLGDDFLVPADAEFVIEAILRPGKRDLEGPFGEYARYYGPQRLSHVLEVTAITHRDEAIMHAFMVGMNNNLGSTQEEGTIYSIVKQVVPEVKRVYVPVSGAGRFHAYIQIRKTREGQPKEAILSALTASEMTKHVIVVDDDIDVFNERWVLWAVATRSQWDKDLVVVPGCRGALDPSSGGEGGFVTTKGGIDATKPAPPKKFPLRVGLPKEVREKVKIEKLLGPEKVMNVPDMYTR
jgi:2,5-furandicarboxylate decarboxylase 1